MESAGRLAPLEREIFDVAIVGGGIIGSGIARDAALRRLKVALFEKNDFGSGTTAGSTRLIHGGLRYLEHLDFRLVRLDLREREILLRIAPHLVKPLPFLLPFYDWSLARRLKIRAGMLLYDLLSYDKSQPSHSILDPSQVKALEPHLRTSGLQGGALYYDAQVDLPERLCLENILDAVEQGARAFNYTEVLGPLDGGGDVLALRVRDGLTGESVRVRSRLVVNSAGPWLDRVLGALTGSSSPLLRTTKGIHLACPPLNRNALVFFSSLDQRLFFVIPWLGYSWIGTTDTDFCGEPSQARGTAADVAYLLRSAREFLPALASTHVHFTNAGVRALVREDGSESSVTRMHRVLDGDQLGCRGLISVLGGKITGYRSIAQEVTDRICAELKVRRPCRTAALPLPGARPSPSVPPAEESLQAHLHSLYGTRAGLLRELARVHPELNRPLHPAYPDLAAQVVFAARSEFCLRLSDFFLRRTRLGFTHDQGRQALPAAARLLAQELGWTEERRQAELRAYLRQLDQTQAFRGEAPDGPETDPGCR